jgi:hypothetical protein
MEGSRRRSTRSTDRIGESSHAESSFPEDPRQQRRVRNRLIALALAVPIAQLLWFLFR